jgi:hypothetical protein
MKFGTWNVRSLNKSDSIRTVAWELPVYELDLVGAQWDRWDTGGNLRAGVYYRIYGKENQFGTVFVPHTIISVVKTVEFVRNFFMSGCIPTTATFSSFVNRIQQRNTIGRTPQYG